MPKLLFRLLTALIIVICRVQSSNVSQQTTNKDKKSDPPVAGVLESSWANLQLSPLAVKSMPYRDFRVKIYQHGGDLTIRKSNNENQQHQRYFYTPIALLDHRSAVSSHNNVTGEAELFFVIHLWDEALEANIVEYLSNVLGEDVKKHQLEVIPFEWVVVTTPRSKLTGQYSLDGVRQQYQQEKFLRFSMICSSVDDCDALAEQMKFNPRQFYNLKLKLGLESQKTRRKETTVRISSIQSGEFFSRLKDRYPHGETVLLSPKDAKRLISESANSIIVETFDDTEVVDHQHSNIYWAVEQLMAMTKQKVDQLDNIGDWESLYWEKENQRPDKMAWLVNRIYNTTDSKGRQMLLDFFDSVEHSNEYNNESTNNTNDLNGALASWLESPALLFDDDDDENSTISKSSSGYFSLLRQMNAAKLQQLLREAKKSINWIGDRFSPKSIIASKINLGRIMSSNSSHDFTDRKLFVTYASSLLVMSIKIDDSLHFSIERRIQERFDSAISEMDSRYKMKATKLQNIIDGLLSDNVELNKKIEEFIGSQITALEGDLQATNATVFNFFQRIESKVESDHKLLQNMTDQVQTDMGTEHQLQKSALKIIFQKIDTMEQNANVSEHRVWGEFDAINNRNHSEELIKLKDILAKQMMVVDRTYAAQMELLEGRLRSEANQNYQDQMNAMKSLLERYAWLLHPLIQGREEPITTTTPSPWKTFLELLKSPQSLQGISDSHQMTSRQHFSVTTPSPSIHHQNPIADGRNSRQNVGSSSLHLKNGHGKCLASLNNDGSDGTKLIQQTCLHELGQYWRIADGNRICNGWNKCITAPFNTAADIRLIQMEINGQQDTGQKWQLNKGRLENDWKKCLTVSQDSTANGVEVWAMSCIPGVSGLSEDNYNDESNVLLEQLLSKENYLNKVRVSFNEMLTYFNHFMVKIFKINENGMDQKNEEDQRCIMDDMVSVGSSDDDLSYFDVTDADNKEKIPKGLSTAQMITYFQDRYNNSDILPSVKDSFIYISVTVTETENYIADYNKSVPVVITTISDLEEKSFRLGQKLHNSAVTNSIRSETINRMKTESETIAEQLFDWTNLRNIELSELSRLHEHQENLIYDGSFLGVNFVLVAPIEAVHKDVKTAQDKIRGLAMEVKLSETHLDKLQSDIDSALAEYESTKRLARIDFADQLDTNSTLKETKTTLKTIIDDGVAMKKVATFVTLLHGKLKVLYDVTASETPKDIIKVINVKDIFDYFEKDGKSGKASIFKELATNETVANEFSRLVQSSKQADDESLLCFRSSLDQSLNTSIENKDDETSPFRRKRASGDIDSDIEIGDQMLMNISDVYNIFRKGMTSLDDFQWDQLLSTTATGTAVLSDLMVMAFSTPDILLTRTRSFNPKKQHHRGQRRPVSLRNILTRISNMQYNALIQYHNWIYQLQIMSLNLPDSFKTTITLLRVLLGNPNNSIEPSSEMTQLISLQLNNTLMLTSEKLRNQSIEIEDSLQGLVDFAAQFDGASIARKEQRHLYTSDRCSLMANAENVYEDEFQESNLDGIQQMIDGWNNLIVFSRIIMQTVKELVIPELESFQYLAEWSVKLAIQRHHQTESNNESPALPLIHRLISQAAKASRAVYLLHETTGVYLKVSTRHLMPQTINLDEILALNHPLSAQDLAETRRHIERVGQQEKESIIELTNEAKRQMIVKLTEHEKSRQVDNGHQHCSFNPQVGHRDIKDCVRLEGGCDRYFLMSFLCA